MVELAKKIPQQNKYVIVMLRKEYIFYVRKAVGAALFTIIPPLLEVPTGGNEVEFVFVFYFLPI